MGEVCSPSAPLKIERFGILRFSVADEVDRGDDQEYNDERTETDQ